MIDLWLPGMLCFRERKSRVSRYVKIGRVVITYDATSWNFCFVSALYLVMRNGFFGGANLAAYNLHKATERKPGSESFDELFLWRL
jgi:hypothetical protein